MSGNDDLAAAIEAAATLADILEDENKALAASDFGASARLASGKRSAIAQAEALLGAVGQMPRERRSGLVALHRRLDTAIGANRALLQQSIDTQQRVIETVLRAFDIGHDADTYPPVGASEPAHRPVRPVALALRA